MTKFDSIIDLEGRLEEFESQSALDWMGDPVRLGIDQSIENDVFEKYEEGEYLYSLTRLATYLSVVILRMLSERNPEIIVSLSEHAQKSQRQRIPVFKKLKGALATDLTIFEEVSRTSLNKLMSLLGKDFRNQIQQGLIMDLHIIRKLRNAYAHRLTPTEIQFTKEEHERILKAIRDTWHNLREEYCKVVK